MTVAAGEGEQDTHAADSIGGADGLPGVAPLPVPVGSATLLR